MTWSFTSKQKCRKAIIVAKIPLPTEWKRKAASEQIRRALQAPFGDKLPEGGVWRYYVEFPSLKQHQNHFDTTESKVKHFL
jgi:hypothetical protein